MVDVVKWVDSTVRRRNAKEALESDARRAQVVQAAIDAIEEGGAAVGMGQIAERAGIPRPNVYRHFASKEQLDAEVARYAATELLRRVRPYLSTPGTPVKIIRGLIAPCVAWAAEHPHLFRFLAAQQQTKALHRARLGRTRLLSEIVDAARSYLHETPLSADPPEGVLVGVMGMVDASIIWWFDHHDETQEQLVERLTRQVAAVLVDTLGQFGVVVPDDMVFRPEA
ncbi:AcrR family transcriptional regulator [Nocardioides aromaticivorans]|uniref:AcrR family transcriptional regulator n=1 Tax=Nocardioides aromaticivorans TaxID=200618 RepID=A0A7Y9ZFU9_9ACTN|nr:TetR/AcrR family transcriptional regulator [Nocardioides aromaticivorans]NYI44622.1 AcrR family transcriptional regulator [Nocardioides aromaticivorans]